MKYAVFTEKSLRLLGKNQYTSNVESGFTKTEIKHWVELFFGVKVVAVNSHRLPGKGRRMGPILGHTMHYRRMIITLQPGILFHFYFLIKLKGILKKVFLSFSQLLSFESNFKFD
uniref:Large ribosomal subunit protein uL23c n=1 Tax=Arundo formosana TaxID=983981 RepID=A0A873WYT5_9POAL|nr:acetyl-CoA carboxylase carboxyltransferase beta subunit [Arundo formosana]QPB15141.1 acetyl-CoA carboxylase carboxyltransferase beta subunit [Arundo formosana]